jgi:D-sedoheptulose 7-phosphate isomerase
MDLVSRYLDGVFEIARMIKRGQVIRVVGWLASVREHHGRLFLLGVGGSAASCSHAVSDFRKACGIEAYTPVDNVSELTARTNDDGWLATFEDWLRISQLRDDDVVMVLSVGGGSAEVSQNIVSAVRYAKSVGAAVVGIVGEPGGYTAQVADACIMIPKLHDDLVTPFVESFHSVICHLLVACLKESFDAQ